MPLFRFGSDYEKPLRKLTFDGPGQAAMGNDLVPEMPPDLTSGGEMSGDFTSGLGQGVGLALGLLAFGWGYAHYKTMRTK